MTYFNNFSNSGFYSAPFASYESATYPFMNQMLANEGQNAYKFTSATDDWRTRGQPSLFTGHQAGAGFGSTTSLIPNAAYTHGYGLPLSSGPNWSATDQAQPRCSSFVDWSTSFADTVTSESTTMIAAPSRAMLNYWGGNQSGPSTTTPYVNVWPADQRGAERTRARRPRPYEVPGVRPNIHRNAEAGPSTLVPPAIPHVAPLTTNPAGGTSETTADAEQASMAEGDVTTRKPRLPRGKGIPRKWRNRHDGNLAKLCVWAGKWENLGFVPSSEVALGVALEVVKKRRVLEYNEPCLKRGQDKKGPLDSKKGSERERQRRKDTREIYETFSKYYRLPDGAIEWMGSGLLIEVLKDTVYHAESPADRPSAPQPSGSATENSGDPDTTQTPEDACSTPGPRTVQETDSTDPDDQPIVRVRTRVGVRRRNIPLDLGEDLLWQGTT